VAVSSLSTLSDRELDARIMRHQYVRSASRRERGSYAMRQLKNKLTEPGTAFAMSKAKRKVGCCGRRSSKTVSALAALLISGAAYPGALSAYAAISVGRAVEILDPAIQVIDHAGCPLKRVTREGLLYLECPNGHRIWVAGCPNRRQVDSFRGNPLVGVVLDESYSMDPYLPELVEGALEPALMDYDGWLGMIGSPGPSPVGYFHSAQHHVNGVLGWEAHHWDARQNQFIEAKSGKTPEQWFEEIKARHGWNDDTPQFAREYLGLWVLDAQALCYPYEQSVNLAEFPIEGEWRTGIGIDLGVVDDTAFVVGKWRHGFPEVWLVDAFSRSGLSPSAAAAQLIRLKEKYRPSLIVADTGGIGKAFVAEWADRYSIGVQAASKVDTAGQIGIMAGELRSGVIKVSSEKTLQGPRPLPALQPLVDQWLTIMWDEDRRGHDDRYTDHLADAARYLVMSIRARYRPEPEPPVFGSPEWMALEDERERRIVREIRRKEIGRRWAA